MDDESQPAGEKEREGRGGAEGQSDYRGEPGNQGRERIRFHDDSELIEVETMPESPALRYGPRGRGPVGPFEKRRVVTALYFTSEARNFGGVKRILVIDDDARLREQYTELLRLEGYEVIEARNGREGVERARRDLPDLVICDITMPEMNGHRVLETLRSEPRTAHLPFVFLTGWNEQEDVRTGMNLGADDYLMKPLVPAELSAAVRARLRRAELTAAASSARGTSTPFAEQKPAQLAPLGLTPREAEVLFWVARGKTNDEIATVLGIGLTTVKKHLESTYAKLGVENRTTAAAMALEQMK